MNSDNQISENDLQSPDLKKRLTVFDSVCLVVGSVIGSGIFVSPTHVVGLLNESLLLSLAAWIIAALISLAGALCYAELGCMFPKAGAEYEYLKNGIGRFWGFLFAWAQLIVLGTGSIAIMSIISANYFVQALWPNAAEIYTKLFASGLVLGLTVANCFGIESGSWIQNVLTIIKVISIVFLLSLGLIYLGGLKPENLTQDVLITSPKQALNGLSFNFGAALIACLWAFDGWNNLSRVNEESVNVQKTLPKGLTVGLLFVTLIYLALNCLYFLILPASQIVQSKAIALSALSILASKAAWLKALGVSLIVSLIISFSASGATNGSVLSGARIYFAAARDKLFFEIFGRTDPKTKAPVPALILQGVWTVFLICLGNFETLLNYFSFSAWLFYGACACILIYLRQSMPQMKRPYKVLAYPITPIIFLIAAIYLVLSQIITSPLQSGLSLLGILSGLLFYFPFVRKPNKAK